MTDDGTVLQVSADRTRCLGAAQCVLSAPGVFDQNDDDGLVVVLREFPSAAQEPAVAEAVGLCPNSAIRVTRRPPPGHADL